MSRNGPPLAGSVPKPRNSHQTLVLERFQRNFGTTLWGAGGKQSIPTGTSRGFDDKYLGGRGLRPEIDVAVFSDGEGKIRSIFLIHQIGFD
jgi:hypothetical protein